MTEMVGMGGDDLNWPKRRHKMRRLGHMYIFFLSFVSLLF